MDLPQNIGGHIVGTIKFQGSDITASGKVKHVRVSGKRLPVVSQGVQKMEVPIGGVKS